MAISRDASGLFAIWGIVSIKNKGHGGSISMEVGRIVVRLEKGDMEDGMKA